MENLTTLTNLFPTLGYRGIGFDRMLQTFDDIFSQTNTSTYPPYNILKVDDNEYVVELALAGFDSEDIEITETDKKLSIVGKKSESGEVESPNYLYKGISNRSFKREFALADNVYVDEATFNDGLLRVSLKRELPEGTESKKIEIKKPK